VETLQRRVCLFEAGECNEIANCDASSACIHGAYGKVEIGERFYTCPVHGMALSKVPFNRAATSKTKQPNPLQTELNDVSFEQYHIFRGEPRIALDATEQP
jgi:hypothetical protein